MDPVGLAIAFVTDPRVGLPIVLLSAAAFVWFALGSPAEPRSTGFERPPQEPDRDGVSRTYLALRRDQYSAVLLEVYQRLDAALVKKTGRKLGEIPWRRPVAEKLGIPEPRQLERTRVALDALYLWAVRLETDSLLRLDFWRTWDESHRVFLKRAAERLHTVERQLGLLGYVP